jgi:alkylated DNA nucleotide flippase Atl1
MFEGPLKGVQVSIHQAIADLAQSFARDLNGFANRVLELGAIESPIDFEDLPPDPADQVSGSRQAQVVALPGLADDDGMKTGDIAEAIGYDQPNTYTTLQTLSVRGLVELIPNKHPQHWRLVAKYRASASSQPYLEMARLVRRGEWTTYGDISIAVRGETSGARAVGRAAATLPHFPSPHRVLQQGGSIPEGWRDSQGRGPDECRRRLEQEGVLFRDGLAETTKRVMWDELVHRSESQAGEPTS